MLVRRWIVEQANARRKFVNNFGRAVGRSVVNDNNFDIIGGRKTCSSTLAIAYSMKRS